MLSVAKGANRDRVAASGTVPDRGNSKGYDMGILIASNAIGENLPRIVDTALASSGIKATPEKLDRTVISIWISICGQLHATAIRCGCSDTPLNPDCDLNELCPKPIQEAARRIGYDLPAALVEVHRILKIESGE